LQRKTPGDNLPFHRAQQRRVLCAYAALSAAATVAAMLSPLSQSAKAMLIGVSLPGGGFLNWASGDQSLLASALFAAGLCTFAFALLLWFGTGNVIAPAMAWAALAWLAGRPESLWLDGDLVSQGWQFIPAPVLATALAVAFALPRRLQRETGAQSQGGYTAAAPAPPADEMPLETLQRLRLLLDRALQPIERFDGFEWRDQFQTAAVRYQVNFLAYALAMARHQFAPAADGYFLEAQVRLLAKIGDQRLWRYWRYENAWGRLRLGADPVPDVNIMYSGFTMLQMAISGQDANLVLHKNGREWRRYGLGAMADLLARQYRASSYGLLACEPNWIYPLCNLITMAGMKAADARGGTDRWPALSDAFLASLEREGMAADGSFIAFRSALTGIAPPAPGGIVMQAFPCLFLNALSPELAQRHWLRVRGRLETQSWRRMFWPVDVGNYGLSRASGYAATAAAAVEMGDRTIADACLQRLEAECPSSPLQGVTHRSNASLWAHALELLTLCGNRDGLRDLIDRPASPGRPRLAGFSYPDLLVARARTDGRNLDLVLHVVGEGGTKAIELGGLMPNRHYRTTSPVEPFVRADGHGRASLRVEAQGRISLTIDPVV
jgi:hypothetical protein